MSDRVRLEAYVAQPPTQKCRQVIEALEEVVRRHPERARLVVFGRGAPWPEPPTSVLRLLVGKGASVPLCVVGGAMLAMGGPVPTVEDLEGWLLHMLEKRSAKK